MEKGDYRWTVLFLILALLGIILVDMSGNYKWFEVTLIILALINTIIGNLNKKV